MIHEIIAAVCIGLGIVCFVLSLYGVYRFDYVLTRIHAIAVVDTLGTLMIFIGMILLRGLVWASAKILLILAFQWLTSPVSTHRISKVEVLTNPDLEKNCEVKE